MSTPEDQLHEQRATERTLFIAGLVYGLFVLGYFFPDVFWGFHYPSFLSTATGAIVMLVSAILVFASAKFLNYGKLLQQSNLNLLKRSGLAIGIAVIMCFLFNAFPIVQDGYGDSMGILQNNVVAEHWGEGDVYWKGLTSWDFTDTKIGTKTVFGIGLLISLKAQIPFPEAFVWIDLVCGFLFIMLWVFFVTRWITNHALRIVLIMAGCTATLALHFYGHHEIYGPTYVLSLAFLFVMLEYVKTRKLGWLITLFPLFIISFKFHSGAIFLSTGIGFCVFLALSEKMESLKKLFTWKGTFGLFILPWMLLFFVMYFFIHDSAFGNRSFTEDTWDTVLFLPLIASEGPPFERYNLFSWNHIFDYVNIIFMWSYTAVFMFFAARLGYRAKWNAKRPEILVLGALLIVQTVWFFLFNPLFGMTADWDLMCLPAVTLLVLIVVISSELQETTFAKHVFGPGIALSILSFTAPFVNAFPDSQSAHMESIGSRDFKTYWRGTSTSLLGAIDLAEPSTREARLINMLDKLEPHGTVGNDIEYATMCMTLAQRYIEDIGSYEKALPYLKRCKKFYPEFTSVDYHLTTAYFLAKDYRSAFENLPDLVRKEFTSREKVYKMAIHIAVMAEQYQAALGYCIEHLKSFPKDDFIQRVKTQLESAEPARALQMFKQG